MVRSANASLRGMAASALLQYLLDWPLEERRLKQHLHFAVANLAYELEDGRLQARRARRLRFALRREPHFFFCTSTVLRPALRSTVVK